MFICESCNETLIQQYHSYLDVSTAVHWYNLIINGNLYSYKQKSIPRISKILEAMRLDDKNVYSLIFDWLGMGIVTYSPF